MQNPFFFGQNRFPSVGHKAGVLAWSINAGHTFTDGNKRTSTIAALVFLRINDVLLEASNEEVVDIALRVAQRDITGANLEELMQWYISRIPIDLNNQ